MFALDQRLQQDTLVIGDFPLSRLLFSNDSNYPWFILVPRIDGISEVFQLGVADQQRLWQETTALAQLLNEGLAADKMNIGALGNVVSQLHVHVIVRKRDDAAWPAPVWASTRPSRIATHRWRLSVHVCANCCPPTSRLPRAELWICKNV